MIVLFNPWSTPSPKKPLPMSLLALGSVLEGEFDYAIVDGNVGPGSGGHDRSPLHAAHAADGHGVTVMPGPQLQRGGHGVPRSSSGCCRACRSSGAATSHRSTPRPA